MGTSSPAHSRRRRDRTRDRAKGPSRSSRRAGASSCRTGAPRSSARCPGPPGAPTVLLLHGWVATGGLNWFQSFETLGERFRVIAPDLRGHGQGIRSRRVFRLADCADDCAATLVELGTGPVIVVGYSMGGPIAQLLWRRHRDLVSGLVFCATSAGFMPNRRARLSYQSAMLSAVTAARVATLTMAVAVAARRGARARLACRIGSPTRCAVTTGARSWRPATRSARITPAGGSTRSTCRPRSCAPPAITQCVPTYNSRSPTPSPERPCTGSTTVTSRARNPDSVASCAARAPTSPIASCRAAAV